MSRLSDFLEKDKIKPLIEDLELKLEYGSLEECVISYGGDPIVSVFFGDVIIVESVFAIDSRLEFGKTIWYDEDSVDLAEEDLARLLEKFKSKIESIGEFIDSISPLVSLPVFIDVHYNAGIKVGLNSSGFFCCIIGDAVEDITRGMMEQCRKLSSILECPIEIAYGNGERYEKDLVKSNSFVVE